MSVVVKCNCVRMVEVLQEPVLSHALPPHSVERARLWQLRLQPHWSHLWLQRCLPLLRQPLVSRACFVAVIPLQLSPEHAAPHPGQSWTWCKTLCGCRCFHHVL